MSPRVATQEFSQGLGIAAPCDERTNNAVLPALILYTDLMEQPLLIGLDWGTTSCRAYLIGSDRVLARNADQRDGAFARGSGDRRDRFAGDRTLLGVHHLGWLPKTSCNAAMQRRFCSIVPTEMRIHSGRL